MARQSEERELLEMLRELAAIQRTNADRLERLERCFSLVSTALPGIMAERFPGTVDEALEAHEPAGTKRRPRRLDS
jgi:hypothetical protein